MFVFFFFFQAEDGIRDKLVTGVQTCALPIFARVSRSRNVDSDPSDPTARHAKITERVDVGIGGGAQHLGRRRTLERQRSEERRVGKECRSRWSPEHEKKKEQKRLESALIRSG